MQIFYYVIQAIVFDKIINNECAIHFNKTYIPTRLLKMVGVPQEGKGEEARWKREGGGGEKGTLSRILISPGDQKHHVSRGSFVPWGRTDWGAGGVSFGRGRGGGGSSDLLGLILAREGLGQAECGRGSYILYLSEQMYDWIYRYIIVVSYINLSWPRWTN